MTSSAFSSAESTVLEREAENIEEPIEFENIWSEKQQNDCVQWIKTNLFTKVNNSLRVLLTILLVLILSGLFTVSR